MAGKDLVVQRVTDDNGDRRTMELFRTRLDVDDDVELTTETVDTQLNATAAQPAAKEPTDGLVTEATHEEQFVVTWYQGDDPDAPKNRKKAPAKKTVAKKSTAKKSTAKKSTARKTTAAKK